MAIWGVNQEVVPPAKIVHIENMELGEGIALGEMLATVELTERDGQTEVRMTLLFPSKEARDGALVSWMERGVAAGYESLDAIWRESS